MADLAVLEARISALESIEAIKKVKAKYWRCIDKKLWDELADVFSEDAVWYRADGKHRIGRKAILQWAAEFHEGVISTHRGHQPEIEMTSDTTAKALWALDFCNRLLPGERERTGWAYYEDEYVKGKDGWRIKTSKLTYLLRDRSTRETPGAGI